MLPPPLASPPPPKAPRPLPARRSLQHPKRWTPPAPPHVLSLRATVDSGTGRVDSGTKREHEVPPRAPPKWGGGPWVVATPGRSTTVRPSLRRFVGTRAPPKRAAARWTGRMSWMARRLLQLWTEPQEAFPARGPTLRPSLGNIVHNTEPTAPPHRGPPKWAGEMLGQSNSEPIRAAAPRTRWSCLMEARAAAKGAASPKGRDRRWRGTNG